MGFKDHFSGHAEQYAAARPVYPPSLTDYITRLCNRRQLAWDCGCGNGQVSVLLAEHFDKVYASDASAEQIAQARPNPRIQYAAEPAETPSLTDRSVDLITVAQAAHWLDMPRFCEAATRVMRPGGILAIWCYGLNTITPELDEIAMAYYRGDLDPYWPPERRLIESGYRDLYFPFSTIQPDQAFEMTVSWNAEQYAGYLRSWSATQRYIAAHGVDPVDKVWPALKAVWGDAERTVSWPLHLLLTRLG